MKYSFHLILAIFFLGGGVRDASAELRRAGIFSDHMVLRRDQPIQVRGWANAGDKVIVVFADQTEMTDANENGDWSTTFKPLKADSPNSMK